MTADPSWPEGCSRPYDIVLSNKSPGKGVGRGDIWSCVIISPIVVPRAEVPAFQESV